MIGFSRPKKWMPLSWLIMKITGASYSHTFFVTRISGVEMVIHSHISGVDLMPRSVFERKNKIIELIHVPQSEVDKATTFAMCNIEANYGWISLVLNPFKVPFGDGKRTMTCSEFIDRAFRLNIDKGDMVTPVDVMLALQKKVRHEA